MKRDKVIVLASGGLDSSLVMAKLLKEGRTVVPFFSNYNQYAYKGEAKAVRGVRDWLNQRCYTGDSTWLGVIEKVVEVHVDTGLGTVAACPGRVLSFVGAACIWAFTNNWVSGEIAIGIHKGDKDVDSCRVGYEDSLNETVKSLTQGKMKIITPLMGMTREEMAEEIEEIGIPWELMYNCYWGPNPCGYQSENMEYRCPGCRRKQDAMRHVGRPDTEWKVPNRHPFSDREIARRDWKYS
jgi:7-cyano-7-deazaguanine synthase